MKYTLFLTTHEQKNHNKRGSDTITLQNLTQFGTTIEEDVEIQTIIE